MFEEMLFQRAADSTQFVEILQKQGIVTGVKVYTSLTVLPRTAGDTATTGLDGLPDRCKNYYAQGGRFAKWRAVMRIGGADGAPSDAAILYNTHASRDTHISQRMRGSSPSSSQRCCFSAITLSRRLLIGRSACSALHSARSTNLMFVLKQRCSSRTW
jgi:Fructose-bisphosphate aldolase class-I